MFTKINENKLNISIKTIFRDCFSFKKIGLKHPYESICNKYSEAEYLKFRREFHKNFTLNRISIDKNTQSSGILTGYYEPLIKAFSYPKKGSYPIYKNPSLRSNKIDTNITRKEINNGYLKNNNLEIAWVENEIEAFFLQIQGSGRLELENKRIIKVRFAGSNNKKYTSIGKVLIKNGYLKKKDIDMYKIKEWLYKNKDLSRKLMNMNERYIFFEEYQGKVKGSGGIDLVPGVSIAVDKRFISKGEAIIIQDIKNRSEVFLGVAHDEGSAIKGEKRIDLFSGYGISGEKKAAKSNKKILTRKLLLRK